VQLPYPDADDATKLPAITGGNTYAYPGSYGYGSCTAHDSNLPPSCADAEGNALEGAPAWCASEWCYVDPETCNIAHNASSYFERDDEAPKMFYSYATCGGANTFDDNGLDTCECMTTPSPHAYASADNEGKVVIKTGTPLTDYLYKESYGFNNCYKHDKFLPPSCAANDGTPVDEPESWCNSRWCFVDKDACTGADTPVSSSYFKREG
jgi:hypothetical protein